MTENKSNVTEVDPLSEAVGDVDTSFPVLMPDRQLPFLIKSATKEVNAETKKESIKLKLVVEKDTQFRDHKPCYKGFAVSIYIGVTPSEKYSVDDIKRNVAMWVKSALGVAKAKTVSVRAILDKPSILEGAHLECTTSIKVDKTGAFPDSTNLRPVLPPQ